VQVGDPKEGTMTVQIPTDSEVVENAIPEPDNVMTRPACKPPIKAVLGVKAIVAVVEVALTLDESVTARPLSQDMAGNMPVVVPSSKTGKPTDMSLNVPAAILALAGIP
jgi:hypothetical protein